MFEDFETERCERCRQPLIHQCAECAIRYCSGCPDQDHWCKCKSFEICYSEKFGYHVQAARNISAGEIIFCELPLAYGPQLPIEDGRVPCVGCCRLFSAEKILQCLECLWPACSPDCEDLKNDLKHGLECKILRLQKSSSSDASAKTFRFEILLPLKILLLQTSNKSEWKNLLKRIEENSEEVDSNMNDLPIKFLEENYLIPLKKIEEETGSTILEHKSSNLLKKIFHHLKITKFKPTEDVSLDIFYPTFSLIEQSCTPNSFQTIEDGNQYKITIRANSPITKNTHITSSSTNLFQRTYHKLSDLKTANFDCSCSRCKDPTEFGTFFSALKCLGTRKEPCGGNQLPVDPTNPETLWVCDRCQIELPNDQMVKFVKHLGREVDKILIKEATVEELEELLAKLLMFLHPDHFYVCDVKHALVKSYGEDSVSTKIEICKSLVEVVRKLYPNGGLPLVELLLELLQAQISVLQKNCNEDNKTNFGTEIQEVKELHQELENNIYVIVNPKLRQTLNDEEIKLNSWLHQMSLT